MSDAKNSKLWPRFEKKLGSAARFQEAVDELVVFMSDDRAFYNKARPMVRNSLHRRQLNVNAHSSYVK